MQTSIKVLIGTPSRDTSLAPVWARLDALAKPPGTRIIAATESSIARARNTLCHTALAEGMTHLLMVDDDMLLPADTLTRLLAHAVPIVSAHYRSRYPPHFASLVVDHFTEAGLGAQRDVSQQRGLQRCAGVGAGCLLITTDILRQMAPPWFVCGDPVPDLISEDFSFCRRAAAAHIPIYIDLDMVVGHVASLAIWSKWEHGWVMDVQGVV